MASAQERNSLHIPVKILTSTWQITRHMSLVSKRTQRKDSVARWGIWWSSWGHLRRKKLLPFTVSSVFCVAKFCVLLTVVNHSEEARATEPPLLVRLMEDVASFPSFARMHNTCTSVKSEDLWCGAKSRNQHHSTRWSSAGALVSSYSRSISVLVNNSSLFRLFFVNDNPLIVCLLRIFLLKSPKNRSCWCCYFFPYRLWLLGPVQTPLHSCAEPNWWIKYGKRAASESIWYGTYSLVRQKR